MTHLHELENQRCTCLPCPDCFGSGRTHIDRNGQIAMRIADATDIEPCPTCYESGIAKVCARCQAINYVLKYEGRILEAA